MFSLVAAAVKKDRNAEHTAVARCTWHSAGGNHTAGEAMEWLVTIEACSTGWNVAHADYLL